MDTATKIGIVVGFVGIGLTLLEKFLGQEVKRAPRWLRLTIFCAGAALLIVGGGVVWFSPTPVAGLGPRLAVTDLDWFLNDGDSVPEARTHVKNVGDRGAIDPIHHWSVGFSKSLLSPTQIDKYFEQMHADASSPNGASTREIEPGSDGLWFPLRDLDPADRKFTRAQIEKMARYVFLLLLYYDNARRQTIETEYCVVFWQGDFSMCDGHNHIGDSNYHPTQKS